MPACLAPVFLLTKRECQLKKEKGNMENKEKERREGGGKGREREKEGKENKKAALPPFEVQSLTVETAFHPDGRVGSSPFSFFLPGMAHMGVCRLQSLHIFF